MMNKSTLIVVLLWVIIQLVSGSPIGIKSDTIKVYIHKSGEAIAIDNLIHQYEKEHRRFYEEEIKNGHYLEWPALNNKNLNNYCRKYLQHSVPLKRNNDSATGLKIRTQLHYEKENTSLISEIVIVQCRIKNKQHKLVYYITRSPEPNCVYSLRCRRSLGQYVLTIIYKHCNFEDIPLRKRSHKRKSLEIVGKTHHVTGQPIANEKYLFNYETEHQQLYEKEGQDKFIHWPYVMLHGNLDLFCYQYMRECAPYRNHKGVKGSWKTEKLHYQKLNPEEDIIVTVVICAPITKYGRLYYMTRAPETNCVYALLRKNRHATLQIKFKHCDFEDPDEKQILSQDYDIPHMNVIQSTETKEEIAGSVETLHLLP